ncbi:hypothetical protein BJ973_008768 [Actinoplanes tereljensis]|uniref:DUF4386 domain-containing protein n=1 Tax=Paractinoplanes tereljensis TaxID=571912 RepID=A0A919NHY3_9ACTN|nr:DUF4386 domain-containing protein [Actinoplanes tereljensis]GIF18272.1 hypothetical protein Ate02nite_10020 [Actinoplanes tereljensis]
MNARIAGALYLLTFLTSIPTLVLYQPVRDNADFVLGAGSATSVTWGILLEVLLALACAGTAVALFPIAKRRSETAAVGFLSSRLLEAGLILLGAVSLLALLTLRRDAAGADPASLVAAGHTLLAVYDGAFLVGQSLMPVLNAAFLGSVMYQSGLVPRVIPVVGLIGAPLLLASDVAILFGLYERDAPLAALAALPIAAWELALGFYLLFKGFRPSPMASRLSR